MLHYQIQTIKPLTTAHLAQTMTLLGMTSAELQQKIESELSKNPALEISENRYCPTCHRLLTDPGPCPVCSRPKNDNLDEPIVFVSSHADYFTSVGNSTGSFYPDELPDDNLTPTVDLATYVLSQIAAELKPEERPIVAHILTSLDEDGFLTITPFEISRYHHVPIVEVEGLIKVIQKANPIGVGSANPKEAMLIQLEILDENQYNVPVIARTLIEEGLQFLSRHQHIELAKKLNLDKNTVSEAAEFISKNLNPFPGRAYWGDHRQESGDNPQVYQTPDIIINEINQQNGSKLVVEILLPLRGTLQINPLFKQATEDASDDNVDQWKKDLENANLLIKCIQQRNHTMERLMRNLAMEQSSFIRAGEKYLQPTTRAEVAERLDVHESTISRAVSGKCVQLPSGKIIPLSMFFDRSLPIRAEISDIIKSEPHAYTDSQLVDILSKRGINIARRTVAKYRSMEGILPAHLRKKLKKRTTEHGKKIARSRQ